jgi:small-conductance mechanosensitive channel
VGGARSDLLFTVLGRLREMGIALSAPQSMVLINDGPGREIVEAPATV